MDRANYCGQVGCLWRFGSRSYRCEPSSVLGISEADRCFFCRFQKKYLCLFWRFQKKYLLCLFRRFQKKDLSLFWRFQKRIFVCFGDFRSRAASLVCGTDCIAHATAEAGAPRSQHVSQTRTKMVPGLKWYLIQVPNGT